MGHFGRSFWRGIFALPKILFLGLTLWFEAAKLDVEIEPSQSKIKHHNHTQNQQKKSFRDLNDTELTKIEQRIGLTFSPDFLWRLGISVV